MLNKLLEKAGLKYEDLNDLERETLNSWSEKLGKGDLTTQDIRSYIISMRDSVEQELIKTDLNSKQDLFLKARLRNYMLLEAYLSTPEKAKKAIQRSISSLIGKG